MLKLLTILGALALSFGPATAADFSAPILGLDGKPMPLNTGPDAPTATLSDVVISALSQNYADEQTLSQVEKLRRFKLALRISDAKSRPLDLPADDVALIERLVSKLYGPIVVGRVFQMLEPNVNQ